MTLATPVKKILMVDDNPGDVRLVQYMLSETTRISFELVAASCLSAALMLLKEKNDHDLILLDMMLPDAVGFDSLLNILRVSSDVPVIMLSTIDDEDLAVQAVQLGAHDFLVKSYLTAPLLVRALRYASERNALQKQLKQLTHLAHHDNLTGLPNRTQFMNRISKSILWSRRHQRPFVVMLLDLNNFKIINDTFGHQAGDNLLTEVAYRFKSILRETDCVARLSGDEFAIILGDIWTSENAEVVAKKIQNVLTTPIQLNGQEIKISASIGISEYPENGLDIESLIMSADQSMYKAKSSKTEHCGLSAYVFSSSVSRDVASQKVKDATSHSNEYAQVSTEICLSYQSIVAIDNGLITGVEMFMPQQYLPSDAQAVSVASNDASHIAMVNQSLTQACRQVKKWQQSGFPKLKLVVNISAVYFQATGFVSHITEILEETGLDANHLKLTFTEDLFIKNELLAAVTLNKLGALGVGLILDHFGRELSPLSYLKRFPIDAVRISPSIIENVPIDPEAAAMFNAIVSSAHILKLQCIIKGVENKEQLTFFRDTSCSEAQGNAFSQPLIDLDFTELLRDLSDSPTKALTN